VGKESRKTPGGRPVLYPDSPMHIYWRELKRREKLRKQAIEAPESTPEDEAVLAVDTRKVEAGA